jgi:hypothetical protein
MSSTNNEIASIRSQVTHIEDPEQYSQAQKWLAEFEGDDSVEASDLRDDLSYFMDEYNADVFKD